jgi:hypothetical protein
MTEFNNVNFSKSKTRIAFEFGGISFLLTAKKRGFFISTSSVDADGLYVKSHGDSSVEITTLKFLNSLFKENKDETSNNL